MHVRILSQIKKMISYYSVISSYSVIIWYKLAIGEKGLKEVFHCFVTFLLHVFPASRPGAPGFGHMAHVSKDETITIPVDNPFGVKNRQFNNLMRFLDLSSYLGEWLEFRACWEIFFMCPKSSTGKTQGCYVSLNLIYIT